MLALLADTGASAAALFTDIKSAYYSVVRQLVVGTDEADDALRGIPARMNLQPEVQAEVVRFVQEQRSLMQARGAPPTMTDFMRELNEDTWFVVDGAQEVTRSAKGARPGETIADLVFIFLLSKGHA